MKVVCYAFVTSKWGISRVCVCVYIYIFCASLSCYLTDNEKYSIENHTLARYVGHRTERLYNSYEGYSIFYSSAHYRGLSETSNQDR